MTEQWAKVLFELDPEYWPGPGAETLWAEPVAGSEWRRFRLMNSPFYARGVSYLDVVRATPVGDANVFQFEAVLERSGHSTYMLIMQADEARVNAYWNRLQAMGCTYESTYEPWKGKELPLYSVDVPPSTDLQAVYDLLERGELDKVWVFQEGHAHLPRSTAGI